MCVSDEKTMGNQGPLFIASAHTQQHSNNFQNLPSVIPVRSFEWALIEMIMAIFRPLVRYFLLFRLR